MKLIVLCALGVRSREGEQEGEMNESVTGHRAREAQRGPAEIGSGEKGMGQSSKI